MLQTCKIICSMIKIKTIDSLADKVFFTFSKSWKMKECHGIFSKHGGTKWFEATHSVQNFLMQKELCGTDLSLVFYQILHCVIEMNGPLHSLPRTSDKRNQRFCRFCRDVVLARTISLVQTFAHHAVVYFTQHVVKEDLLQNRGLDVEPDQHDTESSTFYRTKCIVCRHTLQTVFWN